MAEGSTVVAWILKLVNRLEEISQAGTPDEPTGARAGGKQPALSHHRARTGGCISTSKTLNVWLSYRKVVYLGAAVALMLLNTLVIAWGLRTVLADFPGWTAWRMSFVVWALIIWKLWNSGWEASAFAASQMTLVWLLLPAGYLGVAFFTWQLPAADPVWLLITAGFSTATMWLLAFIRLLNRHA